jgi:hypothetical protein
MSDGIVGNLMDAWGVEDDGPDPTKLPGLLQMAEAWLEDEENDPSGITHHFETMKNRLVGAHVDRSQALNSGEIEYDEDFASMVRKNLSDMVSVEKALEKFIESSSGGEKDECWEALGELEEAIDAMKESGDAIEQFLDSSPLVCMSCSSIGPEHLCPKCGGERLMLDPAQNRDDERKVQVSEEVLDVYESYVALLAGNEPISTLVNCLQSLEFTYLEVEAIGEQSMANELATDRIKQTAQLMLGAIAGVLQGIEMMHGVVKSRSIVELNAGWEQLLSSSVRAQELLVKMTSQAETLG